MKAKKEPPQEYLNKIFKYDPESGLLYNKIHRCNRALKDAPAGYLDKIHGYLVVGINYKLYKIHRIIWVMEKDSINRNLQIDHIDHNRQNNKLENLRLVTPAENDKNRKMDRRNTSGHTGVYWNKHDRKWMASIRVKGELIYLGYFETIEDAIEARKEAEVKCGFHKNHGEETK